MSDIGLQQKANPGRELIVDVDGTKYVRYPIKTKLVLFEDNLSDFIREYTEDYQEGDIFCIASKIVSITKGFYIHEKDLKVGWLAKFLVKFVKKWPNDKGFAIPQKIQWSMDIAGKPRFIFAVFAGAFMKLLGKPGYFYRLVGHNIRSIDGFIPEEYPEGLKQYGFIAPDNCDMEADLIEKEFGYKTAILDGNNVENIIMGMSKGLKKSLSSEHLSKILRGNPQGQDDGTPLLLVRKLD